MAAPEYVPTAPTDRPRSYTSPDYVPPAWRADRPADLATGQPSGPMLGSPGPDQGYALTLMERFAPRLVLADGEHREDVEAGLVAVALKRASLFGRAPVVYDLEVAGILYGCLGGNVPAELVALRTKRFAGLSHLHAYAERRAAADAVPPDVLRLSPAAARERVASDWRWAVGA